MAPPRAHEHDCDGARWRPCHGYGILDADSSQKADVVEGKVSNAAPTHFCESEDQFVRLDEGWRIARRDFKATIGKHGK